MLPFAEVFGIKIPMFGICSALGMFFAIILAIYRVKINGGDCDLLITVSACSFILVLCGAVLTFYIKTYGIIRLIQEIKAGNYQGFQSPGMVFYGGLVGGILGFCLAAYFFHIDFSLYVNAIVPCVPLGHAFGRIGCLLAGCCYGRHYEGMLAVHSGFAAGETLFPIQAVEAIYNLLLFLFLIRFTKKDRTGLQSLSMYILLYSIARIFFEFFRGDSTRLVINNLTISQWFSILLFITFGFVYFFCFCFRVKTDNKNIPL